MITNEEVSLLLHIAEEEALSVSRLVETPTNEDRLERLNIVSDKLRQILSRKTLDFS